RAGQREHAGAAGCSRAEPQALVGANAAWAPTGRRAARPCPVASLASRLTAPTLVGAVRFSTGWRGSETAPVPGVSSQAGYGPRPRARARQRVPTCLSTAVVITVPAGSVVEDLRQAAVSAIGAELAISNTSSALLRFGPDPSGECSPMTS